MPRVKIRVNPELYNTDPLREFVNKIPNIVAEALSTGLGTEGELSSEEIVVTVQPYGPMDIYHHDIGMDIDANDYPMRSKDLSDRTQKIADRAAETLQNGCLAFGHNAKLFLGFNLTIQGYVWPLLAKGAFKEFTVSFKQKTLQ